MALSRIFQQAQQTPDKTAVVHDGVAVSYAQFAHRIDACRWYFAQQDLPPGTVAVIDVQNLLDAWVCGFALRGLGFTTAAVKDSGEVGKLGIGNIGCVVTVASGNRPAAARESAAHPWRALRMPADIGSADSRGPIVEWHETTIPGGHIMMTSGTTGAYKKVVRNAAVEALALPLHAEINDISEGSVVYIGNFGLWTAGGYRWPLITWSVGGTVVIHQGPDMHAPMIRHDMTHVFATPGTLPALMRASSGTLRRNDATRLLVTGGVMPRSMLAAAKRHLTNRVYSALASTEALTVAVTPLDQPDDLNWHRIHPSREVQVVDEAHNVLEPGNEGLVRVRIIDGLSGYLDDEEATRAFFRDGYFYPGDIGMFGADGRLSLRGRASDVVNVFGDKIATGPIEQALQDKLGAEGVCVVSINNAAGNDEIYVAIQTDHVLDPEEVKVAVNAELGTLKRLPVRAVFIKMLPRNEMGKIERVELKRQLAAAIADKRGRGV